MSTITKSSALPPTERGWRLLYPFASNWTELAGYRCHYVDVGPDNRDATRGETLLISHGNPTWSFHFRELIAACRADRRCVAIDHIGCGLSEKPRREFRLAERIDHLVEFVERLNLENVTLVAQDWGGAIGLGAALRLPQRFRRFVLLNTGAFPPWFFPLRIRVCRMPWFGRAAVQGANLFLLAAFEMAVERQGGLSPEIRAGYEAPYDTWESRRAIYQFVADIPWSRRHPTYDTLTAIEAGLPSLADRPVQLIWGLRDWCFTPECLERFQKLFPAAEVERLESAGHWVLEDAQDDVVRRVQSFLSRRPTTSLPK